MVCIKFGFRITNWIIKHGYIHTFQLSHISEVYFKSGTQPNFTAANIVCLLVHANEANFLPIKMSIEPIPQS